MNDTVHSKAIRERLFELDQALREAIERRDGEAVRRLADRHFRELRLAARQMPDDGGAWVREAADRLRELIRRAQVARDALGAEIGVLGIQRKLAGVPARARGIMISRSFRA